MSKFRLACPIAKGRSLETIRCQDGARDMTDLRDHLRRWHTCNCRDPCTNVLHVRRQVLDGMAAASFGGKRTTTQRWTAMYQRAFPDHTRIPGPCILGLDRTLLLVQRNESRFRTHMLARLAREKGLSASEAAAKLEDFMLCLPVFYDIVTRAEAWPLDLLVGGDMIVGGPSQPPLSGSAPLGEGASRAVQKDAERGDEVQDTPGDTDIGTPAEYHAGEASDWLM